MIFNLSFICFLTAILRKTMILYTLMLKYLVMVHQLQWLVMSTTNALKLQQPPQLNLPTLINTSSLTVLLALAHPMASCTILRVALK